MTTATLNPQDIVSQATQSAQIETLPSDAEILRRVTEIRSRWSVAERIRRRREADRRFSDLLDTLLVDQHAA